MPTIHLAHGSRAGHRRRACPPFGAFVTTEAVEVVANERLTWTGRGLGAVGCHAFVLEPAPGGGCRVVTEETQRGRVVRPLRPVLRPAMRFWHQRWIEALGRP